MPYTPVLSPTTELQAVNACLAAGGEAPVASIVGQRPDVLTAQGLVQQATREVCEEGWTFNTEFGLEVVPAGTLVWTDTLGTETTLNVFTKPVGLLSFEVSRMQFQEGIWYLDTEVRPSKYYSGGGVDVFYDRVLNRDGFERTSLFIDPVWLLDFEKLPQAARDVITYKAVRRYLRDVVNDVRLSEAYAEDEARSLQRLRDRYGATDDFNIFNNAAVSVHRGGRVPNPSQVIDDRFSPGHA